MLEDSEITSIHILPWVYVLRAVPDCLSRPAQHILEYSGLSDGKCNIVKAKSFWLVGAIAQRCSVPRNHDSPARAIPYQCPLVALMTGPLATPRHHLSLAKLPRACDIVTKISPIALLAFRKSSLYLVPSFSAQSHQPEVQSIRGLPAHTEPRTRQVLLYLTLQLAACNNFAKSYEKLA